MHAYTHKHTTIDLISAQLAQHSRLVSVRARVTAVAAAAAACIGRCTSLAVLAATVDMGGLYALARARTHTYSRAPIVQHIGHMAANPEAEMHAAAAAQRVDLLRFHKALLCPPKVPSQPES